MMDAARYRQRNLFHKAKNRLMHPWPFYKPVGGINAVVSRGDSGEHGKPGSKEELRRISTTYAKRWGVGSGA